MTVVENILEIKKKNKDERDNVVSFILRAHIEVIT